jgi:DNA-directed RNA polymerase specialized sigma24 family protein
VKALAALPRVDPRVAGSHPAMDHSVEEELVQAARRQDGDAVRLAVGRLYPALRPYCASLRRGAFARIAREVGLDADDILSEVVRRMIESPPTGSDGRTPAESVRGWVKTTAMRHLIDEQRKRRVREPIGPGGGDGGEGSGGGGDITPDRIVEAQRTIAAHRALLAACFPDGLALYELTAERDGEEEAALAAELGVAVSGLQQRRRRMRLFCSVLDELMQRPRQTDEELARAIETQATPDTQRIFRRVRHYLVARSQGRL